MNEEIFKHLNREQRMTVEATEGRVRVVAQKSEESRNFLCSQKLELLPEAF